MKLEDWRKEIDLIDSEIVKLICQRTKMVRKIGDLKAKAGIDIVDPKRERDILQKVSVNACGDLDDSSIQNIYERILVESRQIQIEVGKSIQTEGVGIY